MPSRNHLRIFFVVVLVSAALFVGHSWATRPEEPDRLYKKEYERPYEERAQVVPPANGITVITGQKQILKEAGGSITAFSPEGKVLYYNETYTTYFDADPIPGTKASVLYVAAQKVNTSRCPATTACWRNIVERVNTTTGNVTHLYEKMYPHYVSNSRKHTVMWHDVDRVNDTHLLISDISRDRVFIVDVETGLVTWQWDAQTNFSLRGGGSFPRDWTHVNDVEYLSDGRILVSLRNQDQVVFLNRSRGLLENQTLGGEDRHSVLYEQHNPDYIPKEHGGPALVVADSQNNRIVEYQRTPTGWKQSWVWSDAELQWPRDADRLPNAHTLIADSNGQRVIEINETGHVVWSVPYANSYDVERLETGDESTNGPSATRIGLPSRVASGETDSEADSSADDSVKVMVKRLLPAKLLNAFLFVLPTWMTFYTDLAFLTLLGTGCVWGVLEAFWFIKGREIRVQRPITTRKKE